MARSIGKLVDEAVWQRINFWIGVDDNDNNPTDGPPAWTPYIGPDRIARAQTFKASLDRLGIPAILAVFPGIGHTMAPEMSATASAFLRRLPPTE